MSARKKKNSLSIIRLGLSFICLIALAFAAHYFLPTNSSKAVAPIQKRAIANDTELQIALAREGFSPGSIDGAPGSQTAQALSAFQAAHNLPITGIFDPTTSEKLKVSDPVYESRQLTLDHFQQIDPAPSSWRERGTRTRMSYNTLLEMLAEQSMSDPDLIIKLNPEVNWSQLQVGQSIRVPKMDPVRIETPTAYLRISLSQKNLQAYDSNDRLLFHCPVSIARKVNKRPSGALAVKVRVSQPNYTFNPAILSGTAEREGITKKFIIQPGPNNPVGSAWIGLNLPSYGIHGTPAPEQVGRTESSGCFRLANWNAETVLAATTVGMPVYVEP